MKLTIFFSCCQKDDQPQLDHVPTLCFERNDCSGLHWLGKDACASHMINAINEKLKKTETPSDIL